MSGPRILAIDPGASGGIVCDSGSVTVEAVKMPDTKTETLKLLEQFKPLVDVCIVEEVGGYVGTPQPGSRMFTFGYGVGVLDGMLWALKIPLLKVRPAKWQTALGCGSSHGLTKTQWKNKLKDKAQALFPNIEVTLSTADALLILEYGRQLYSQGKTN